MMKKRNIGFLVLSVSIIIGGLLIGGFLIGPESENTGEKESIRLSSPRHKGEVSLEEAIFKRRAIRSYKDEALTLEEVSQLLWAAGGKTIDGITGATRAYPSAGGIYPLEIYLVAGEVDGLASGIYYYKWREHAIILVKEGDLRRQLMRAALGQTAVADAPVSIVFTAVYSHTSRKYGKRGEIRYVPMDMGGAGQTVFLQAAALGLGTVTIGAFQDEAVKEILGVKDETPLCIMPVGRK